ncbi:MAG: hypothetical protein ACK4SY_08885 [Pyrobaculum sp.]
MECPYCGYRGPGFRQVRESWRYSIYTVYRLKCPKCGGVFNYYEGKTTSFTIPKKKAGTRPVSTQEPLGDAGGYIYVGQYFLKLLRPGDYREFEQLTAGVFRLLGFKVDELGHQAPGEYPDGIAYIGEVLAVIYDCKNLHNYHMTADDRRAMVSYINKYALEILEKSKNKDIKIYFVVIAQSFDKKIDENLHEVSEEVKVKTSGFAITSDALLYLYSKMIEIKLEGKDIPLTTVIREFAKKRVVTPDVVEEIFQDLLAR